MTTFFRELIDGAASIVPFATATLRITVDEVAEEKTDVRSPLSEELQGKVEGGRLWITSWTDLMGALADLQTHLQADDVPVMLG